MSYTKNDITEILLKVALNTIILTLYSKSQGKGEGEGEYAI
jgi:hypothetical protein